MKTSYVVGGIIILVVLIGGVYVFAHKGMTVSAPQTPSYTTTAPSAPATTTNTVPATQTISASPSAAPASEASAPKSFTVNGNDETADVETITVAKGTPVTITFGADAGTTYHGGLDFRSSVVSTGTITPGSTKTVSFTATQSFAFQPYWPATNIAKPYTIQVVVQ